MFVCLEASRRFGQQLATVERTDDPVDDLYRLGLAYREFAVGNPHLYAVLFSGPIPGCEPDDAARQESLDNFTPLANPVHAAIAAGKIVDEPATVAMGLWAIVHGLVSLELGGNLPEGLDPAAQQRLRIPLLVPPATQPQHKPQARTDAVAAGKAGHTAMSPRKSSTNSSPPSKTAGTPCPTPPPRTTNRWHRLSPLRRYSGHHHPALETPMPATKNIPTTQRDAAQSCSRNAPPAATEPGRQRSHEIDSRNEKTPPARTNGSIEGDHYGVELRELEPPAPSLPASLACKNREAAGKTGAIRCRWMPLRKQVCSRIAPAKTV
ncbi:hypothetical protein Atai01_81150 [Amycolatopsis taiwanensis]|uniref:HTH-type transcriptional regulator MT1864/Rv1816-like C-terminal domain-containing protein n=1 Tax=Amycolatopsis taiwanensis TaxID=342230 RepID=A0A9W6VMF9_9PSEU|nr:hypothetical protein Atai01_81150 [Amycolatopsis taiwanensis]